uniref:Fringe-like glycosyltransferase domain-containing protein n=1 Tax=Biomphalaria glabrata TaxID=6526 RepID=A0A2C9KU68_BIOGL
MRLSFKKVVKYTIFLIMVMFLNIWISYTVNIWSFNNFQDREKSSEVSEISYGGAVPRPPEDDPNKDGEGFNIDLNLHFSRKQRSAKEISPNNELAYYSKDKLSGTHMDRKNNSNLLHKLNPLTDKHRGRGKKKAFVVSEPEIEKTDETGVRETELSDIFISVKTTSKYHQSRVSILLKTWYRLAKEQIYFFTDANDQEFKDVLGDHLVNTNCSADHRRHSLSCKMAVEFDYYMASRKRWFCHVDDDVYLNVPRLLEVLRGYSHKEDWYLGKPSLKYPLEVVDRENAGMKLTFWFATGGAGFCISRSLALKMGPYAGGGRFVTTAEKVRLPDDCTVGYIIEYLLKNRLTVIEEFHSHLETLWLIRPHQLKKQITVSYSEYSSKPNVINVQGFNSTQDPTRFLSLHCFLFPNFSECRVLL